jgi:hypothetical protein
VRNLVIVFLGALLLASCTHGADTNTLESRSFATPVPSENVARYFFSASHVRGVLEVRAEPPSICYSTQTFPSRPIAINAAINGHEEASYAPDSAGDFCDRKASPALTADLVANPSAYVIEWHPTGHAVFYSPLVGNP